MLEIYFDGSCGPRNPGGTAAFGFVIKRDGETIYRGYGRAGSGPDMSNNLAEYEGLYQAMCRVKEDFPEEKATFYGDSTLVINQMNKVSQAKKGLYLPYYKKSAELAEPYIQRQQWSFEWIARDLNSEADDLSQYQRFKPKGNEPNETLNENA